MTSSELRNNGIDVKSGPITAFVSVLLIDVKGKHAVFQGTLIIHKPWGFPSPDPATQGREERSFKRLSRKE
jgi:hypothetical protein